MSASTRAPRVVVGVSDSLTGLRALREGVAAARQRGLELHAVRVYPATAPDASYAGIAGAPAPGPDAGGLWSTSLRVERERAALALVKQAFAMALGGVPADVPVTICVRPGSPRRVLAHAAYDEQDLLIVGTTRRRRYWPFRPALSRYLTEHASCPVLAVPPCAAASELEARTWLRRWALRRSLPRDLSDLTGHTASR